MRAERRLWRALRDARIVRKRKCDDVRRVHNLVLHELVEHNEDHVAAPPPNCGDGDHDVRAGTRIRGARRGNIPRGKVAQEREVALNCIQEVRERTGADGEEGLDGDRAEEGAHVHFWVDRLEE